MAAVSAVMRRRIIALSNGRCEYCGSPQSHSPAPFAIDHISPRSRDGENEVENLALACPGCNGAKYNKIDGVDPATGARVALFHPRQQRWSEHFIWSDDTLILLGISEVGRATIAELHLNREGVVNLRDALQARGLHPPTEPNL